MTETKPGFVGTNVPRKEDKAVQEGVFFDDEVTGWATSISSAPVRTRQDRPRRRLEGVELGGVYGTLTGDEVAILHRRSSTVHAAGRAHQDYAPPSVASATSAIRGGGRRVVARARARRQPSSSRSVRAAASADRRRAGARERDALPQDAGSNVVWSGVFDWGDWEGAKAGRTRSKIDRPVRPPSRRRTAARSSSTTAAPASGRCTATTKCPGSARSDGAGLRRVSTSCASSRRTSAARSAARSASIRSSSRSACSRKSTARARTEWRTDQHTANTATNGSSVTSRSP